MVKLLAEAALFWPEIFGYLAEFMISSIFTRAPQSPATKQAPNTDDPLMGFFLICSFNLSFNIPLIRFQSDLTRIHQVSSVFVTSKTEQEQISPFRCLVVVTKHCTHTHFSFLIKQFKHICIFNCFGNMQLIIIIQLSFSSSPGGN